MGMRIKAPYILIPCRMIFRFLTLLLILYSSELEVYFYRYVTGFANSNIADSNVSKKVRCSLSLSAVKSGSPSVSTVYSVRSIVYPHCSYLGNKNAVNMTLSYVAR